MSIKVLDTGGKAQTGAFKLPEHSTLRPPALAVVLRAVEANADRHQPLTKTRANVQGGGRKPWQQKGTGRARAGSSRSPLWRGGGITFGPIGQVRTYRQVNRKVRRSALHTLLVSRIADNHVAVLKGTLKLEKTKQAASFVATLGWKRTLFVVATAELPAALGVRNLASVELTSADDFNLSDLGRTSGIVFTEAAFTHVTAGAGTGRSASGLQTPATPKKTPPVSSSKTGASVSKPAATATHKPAAKPSASIKASPSAESAATPKATSKSRSQKKSS